MDRIDIMLLQLNTDMKDALAKQEYWEKIFQDKVDAYKFLSKAKQLQTESPEEYDDLIKELNAQDEWLARNLSKIDNEK